MINIILRAALLGMFWVTSGVASAGTISANTWYQFYFDTTTTPTSSSATGCDVTSCTPSNAWNTTFADASPWTFSLSGPATLKVTDAFDAGDSFEVFNSGNSLGLTPSVPHLDPLTLTPFNCEDDPDFCFGDSHMSYRAFPQLPAGNYSLAISVIDAPTGVGSAYFQVTGNVNAVPTPGTFALMLFGLFALWLVQSKRRLVASNVGG